MMRMMVMMDRYRRIHESEEDTATVTATAGPVPSLNNKSSDRTSTQEEEEEEEPRSVPVRPRDRKGKWYGSTTGKRESTATVPSKKQTPRRVPRNYTTDGAPFAGGAVCVELEVADDHQQQHLLQF